jgi:hypothetical protein
MPAFGTAAPLGSVTVPEKRPAVVCASIADPAIHIASATAPIPTADRMDFIGSPFFAPPSKHYDRTLSGGANNECELRKRREL